jgi:eukaryotic-like serine/threonine-protein kinase
MPAKRKAKKPVPSKRYRGMDSLIISPSEIIRRSSVISPFDNDDSVNEEGMTSLLAAIFDDEPLFKRALKCELDEGKYAIKRKLTSGGMGSVYYVYDRDFQRDTAMKVMLPELKNQSRAIDGFIKEARITSQLEHPNIIPVHDMGYLPGHGTFFTMKLIEGETLNTILQRIEIGEKEAAENYHLYSLLGIFRKICDAVAFAHSRKILHRDIKPQNIMVGDYGEVLLMDWGLSRRLDSSEPKQDSKAGESVDVSSDSSLTTDFGVIKGSPAYMSPEQAFGNVSEFDERTDVFLLGATLYQILTCYPPYMGDDVYEIVNKARNYELIPPDELDTGVCQIPEDLIRVIMKAMARKKVDRYDSVRDLADDIDAFLRGEIDFCHRVYCKGDLLMREGDTGSELYIIVKGKVRVHKKGDGGDITISTAGPGDIVGEMSLITSETRSASVTALVGTEVMVLTQELFTQHLTNLPPWLGQTIVLLAERLQTANDRSILERLTSGQKKSSKRFKVI